MKFFRAGQHFSAREFKKLQTPLQNVSVPIPDSKLIVELIDSINKDATGTVQIAWFDGAWHKIGPEFEALNIGPNNGVSGNHATLFTGGGSYEGSLPFFER